MKLNILILSALLGLSATAFGASPAPSAGTGTGPMQHEGFCKQNASECQQLAAKFDSWCSANADKCVSLKAFVEKHRERCEANKEKCKEMMERMHDRHHGDQDKGDDDDTSSPPG
jgi:hypothetical protein